MSRFWHLNLIHIFEFYLAVMFVFSLVARAQQYHNVLRLATAMPGRWPKLVHLVKQHRTIFLTWKTALPAVLTLVLYLVHMLARRLVWPSAELTARDVFSNWYALPFVLAFGVAMLAVDWYATFTVGQIDRGLMEKYFDQAEYWLRSWTAPVVHFFTFGRISPRRMVAVEVQKALLEASRLINLALWWTIIQVSLRIAFGLSLWLTYALSGS